MITPVIDNPVREQVIDFDEEEANQVTFFTAAFFFQCLGSIYNLAAICGDLVGHHGRRWGNYYMRVAFGDEAVAMPNSTFGPIITWLLAFVAIRSQGDAQFPFEMHPYIINVSITSLVIYLVALIAKRLIFAAGLDHTSVSAIIASLLSTTCLSILVLSLVSLLYL